MTANVYEVSVDRLRASVSIGAFKWRVACDVSECRAVITGFSGRDTALRGGLAHLMWHVNGKPECKDCGAWLAHRTSKRCRKGTCEVTS